MQQIDESKQTNVLRKSIYLHTKQNTMHSLKILLFALILLSALGCKDKKENEKFRYFSNYSRTFNDLNDRHLKAARAIGVAPLSSKDEVRKLKGRLKEISSCRLYEIDDLTHSLPYLVPEAYRLVETIARDFKDSLDSKGLPGYSIVVTSVLRTHESVKKLRKNNTNASANSAHVYGTTFDIAYGRFKKTGFRETDTAKLKSVLAEVLHNLQKAKQCYVRYEYRQGCFHITAR